MKLMPKMKLTTLLSTLALVACGGGDAADAAPETEAQLIERARGIHERVITLDTHDDINPSNFTAERNYTTDLGNQVNLPKMEAGGLDVSWMIVYTGQRDDFTPAGYAAAMASAMEHFEAIHRLTEEIAPDRIELALTSDDVRRIVASGKKVAMIGVENAYPVGTDLSNIERFHDLGARYMSLSHNGHSQFADSNTGERDDVWMHGGLSELGRQAIVEMNRLGIMVDLSHPSKESNMQAIALSRAPVIGSHSAARTVGDVSRNMDDELLMALKDNGGVIQTVAFASYVDPEMNRAHNEAATAIRNEVAAELGIDLGSGGRGGQGMTPEQRAEFMANRERVNEAAAPRIAAEVDPVAPPVDVARFVDHIDYLVDLIGIEHVGISSDFDGGGGVEGWDDASETFNVTLELVRRGYTEDEIGMLWSGNLLRVLDEVQAVAAQIQAEG